VEQVSSTQHQSFAVWFYQPKPHSFEDYLATKQPTTLSRDILSFEQNKMVLVPFTAALALLYLAPAALAVGSARVVNNCEGTVYYASVSQGVASSMKPLPAEGFSEAYTMLNNGISIKLAPTVTSPVTQFEFTWSDGRVSYDISNIDGNPFANQGMSLMPSMIGASGFPTCQPVNCPAGQSTCEAAYNQPDDVRTLVCPDASDLVFTLCPGSPSKRDSFSHHIAHRVHSRDFE